VFINASLDAAPLARLIAAHAYEAGASNVHVEWTDEQLSRLKYEKAADDVFKTFPTWEADKRHGFVDQKAAFISIVSSDPDLLAGVDPERISQFQRSSGQALAPFRRAIQSDKVSWTVVAASAEGWAKKVFPEATAE